MERPQIWSEHERDKYEIEAANERELLRFTRYGLEIAVYWLKQTNEVSMTLTEDGQTRQFVLPPDKVMDASEHPEYYANAAGKHRQIKRGFEGSNNG